MSDVVAAAPAPAAAQPSTTAIDNMTTKGVQAKSPVNQPAPKAPAEGQPKQVAEEFFEVPSGGKVKKVSKKELFEKYALADKAYENFEKGAAMRKEAESVLSKLKDPKEALKLLQDPKFGLSKDQIKGAFEDWYHDEFVEPSQLTPEQLKLRDAERRIAEYEKQAADKRKAEEEIQMQEQDHQVAQQLTQEILELIPRSGLPKTRFTASRLAHWIKVNEAKGIKAPAELIIQQVRKEANDIMRNMLDSAEGEGLFELVGESTAKKLNRYWLEKIRAKKGLPNPQPQNSEPRQQPTERLTEADVKRRAREMKW